MRTPGSGHHSSGTRRSSGTPTGTTSRSTSPTGGCGSRPTGWTAKRRGTGSTVPTSTGGQRCGVMAEACPPADGQELAGRTVVPENTIHVIAADVHLDGDLVLEEQAMLFLLGRLRVTGACWAAQVIPWSPGGRSSAPMAPPRARSWHWTASGAPAPSNRWTRQRCGPTSTLPARGNHRQPKPLKGGPDGGRTRSIRLCGNWRSGWRRWWSDRRVSGRFPRRIHHQASPRHRGALPTPRLRPDTRTLR